MVSRSKSYNMLLSAMALSCLLFSGMIGCTAQPAGDVTEALIIEITKQVQTQDEDAIVYLVEGTNTATVTSEGTTYETTKWTFQATNPNDATPHWVIAFDGDSWSVEETEAPLGAGVYTDLRNIEVNETEARQILATAGHSDDFLGWSLVQPLHPDYENPIYTFTYADKAVSIDTVTQVVTVSTFTTEPPLTTTPPSEDSVSLEMIAAADAQIKDVDSNAFVIWAGGRDGDGNSLNQAADTNVWDFTAVLLDDNSAMAWSLTYNGEWTITELPMPPFSVVFNPLTDLTMDVVEAWELVVNAGFEPPFSDWSTFRSLHPGTVNPIYVFPIPGGFAIVDAVTGEVTQE